MAVVDVIDPRRDPHFQSTTKERLGDAHSIGGQARGLHFPGRPLIECAPTAGNGSGGGSSSGRRSAAGNNGRHGKHNASFGRKMGSKKSQRPTHLMESLGVRVTDTCPLASFFPKFFCCLALTASSRATG